MKRWIALFTLLTALLLLTACGRGDAPGPEETPGDSEPLPTATETPPIQTDWNSGVKTDYSGLTPYTPPQEIYTRISPRPLPNLIPGRGYGRLIPYVGERAFYYEGLYAMNARYGLATEEGVLVTDPVYLSIYSSGEGEKEVYILRRLTEEVDEDRLWESYETAVCAADGSFITPFVRGEAYAGEDAIILLRGAWGSGYDMEVWDYSGSRLYNIQDLPIADRLDPEGTYTPYEARGGFYVLKLIDGTAVFVETMTGAIMETEYEDARGFSEGLAPVCVDGLWGYVDRAFNLVIEPQYAYVDAFVGGRAIYHNADWSGGVIDKQGNVLFTAPGAIYREPYDAAADGYYSYYDYVNNVTATYDYDFNKLPEGWGISGGDSYFVPGDGGLTVHKGGRQVFIPQATSVHTLKEGSDLISYEILEDQYDEEGNYIGSYRTGVYTMDGRSLVPPEANTYSHVYTSKRGGSFFVRYSYSGGIRNQVMDQDGRLLFSVEGELQYDEKSELFQVILDDWFELREIDGTVVFRYALSRIAAE